MRALVIDDEPLARDKVSLFATEHQDIEIVGRAGNGTEALDAIRTLSPDLLFLDIQMPGMTGFELLQHLSAGPLPGIIFITAFDEFALRAFEFHALDYLLKPYDKERFAKAVEHARSALTNRSDAEITAEQVRSLLVSIQQRPKNLERLIVKTNGRIIFLRLEEIDWLEAAGNYVKLHVGNESHLMRETMNRLEEQLDPTRFIRIHRSTIVNIAKVREMQPYFNGDHTVILQNNTSLILSRGYRDHFSAMLGKPL